MGAARTVTGVARSEFEDYRRAVESVMADGLVTHTERQQCRHKAERTDGALTVADNRLRLIRFVTGDVQRVRSIEEHCARNTISPLAFDLGPEAA